MKRKKSIALAALTACTCLCLGTLTACEDDFGETIDSVFAQVGGFFEELVDDVFDDGFYDITYAGEDQTYTLTVQLGDEYTIPTIPKKYGCEFIGLFDAKEGGNQYTDEYGNSLEPYSNRQDIELYPRYNPQKFTIYFDYDGATGDTEEKCVVPFGERIAYMPTNLYKEGMDFVGWYTERNGGGTQIAGVAGAFLEYATMNEKLASFGGNNEVLLYAHFKWKVYTVTAHFNNGMTVVKQVEHGTKLSDVPEMMTIRSGSVVTKWKLENTENAAIFDGIVKGDLELYPAEIKTELTITFNGNGGSAPDPMKVALGSTVNLPIISRSDYRFNGWKEEGKQEKFESIRVGWEDMTLVADWTRTCAKYSKFGSITIEDVHTNKNPYDIVSVYNLFGKDLNTLLNEGFSTLKVSFSVYIEEKNDGYQEVYFGTNINLDVDNYCGYGRLWSKSNIQTSGKTTHEFSFSTSLYSLQDTMYFCYSANGSFGDTWYRRSIEATFTIS